MIDAICRIFLPYSRFDLAVEAADVEVRSSAALPKKNGKTIGGEDVADLIKLIEIKKYMDYLKDGGSFSTLRDCTLFNFLDLCMDPTETISTQSVKLAKFGKDRILKAVAYGGPYAHDPWMLLTKFSSKYFRKLRKYDILSGFCKVGNMKSAAWYAQLNKGSWTGNEIIRMVEDMGLEFLIGAELFVEALEHALVLGDIRIAAQATSELLKTSAAAEENINKVLTMWRGKKPNMVGTSMDLLKLLNDESFEPCDKVSALLISFGPSYP